jgi:hypothetical protein
MLVAYYPLVGRFVSIYMRSGVQDKMFTKSGIETCSRNGAIEAGSCRTDESCAEPYEEVPGRGDS